ncbi:MAG: type II toxin-antitoxin system RelE/ParE family toxin, partial [Acidobacteria bacterium]|nr:type II toxin-antitoxin system RelE/ParE family toxin [Acidobacteriota bacterium]
GIALVLSTVEDDVMVLLHGLVKKSAKTPSTDLQVARDRSSKLRGCHD